MNSTYLFPLNLLCCNVKWLGVKTLFRGTHSDLLIASCAQLQNEGHLGTNKIPYTLAIMNRPKKSNVTDLKCQKGDTDRILYFLCFDRLNDFCLVLITLIFFFLYSYKRSWLWKPIIIHLASIKTSQVSRLSSVHHSLCKKTLQADKIKLILLLK